jgi:hypothetical protein
MIDTKKNNLINVKKMAGVEYPLNWDTWYFTWSKAKLFMKKIGKVVNLNKKI